MPIDNLALKWKAFGWNVLKCNGHSNSSLNQAFKKFKKFKNYKPTVILAKTIKGKGIPFMEGHGKWHHKIPNQEEFIKVKKLLGFNEKIRQQFADTIYKIGNKDKNIVVMVGDISHGIMHAFAKK